MQLPATISILFETGQIHRAIRDNRTGLRGTTSIVIVCKDKTEGITTLADDNDNALYRAMIE